MSSVGTYLRDLRQRRGVSLEEIARTTRVAQRYLECLEADDFETLPSPVFTRGFIRAYCQALSEPPEDALAAYEGREGSAPRPSVARPAPPSTRTVEAEPRGRSAVLVSFILLVVLGVALFAVALVIHPRDRGDRITTDVRPEPRVETRQVRPPEPMPTAPPPRPTSPSAGIPGGAPTPAPTTPGSNAMVSAPSAPRPAPGTSATAGSTSASPTPPTVPGASTPAARSTPVVPSAPGATAPAGAPAGTSTSPGASTAPGTSTTPGATATPAPRPAPVAPGTTTPPPAAVAPPAVSGPALEAAMASVTSPYRLVARTNETTWLRVRTEDGRISEENVPPGEVREWISNRPFVVTIGNAGGVTFELNGRTLPPLGGKGTVIQRIVLPPDAR